MSRAVTYRRTSAIAAAVWMEAPRRQHGTARADRTRCAQGALFLAGVRAGDRVRAVFCRCSPARAVDVGRRRRTSRPLRSDTARALG